MSKWQRILGVILAMMLFLASVPLAAADENDAAAEDPAAADAESSETEAELPEELIVCHPTITKGDFFTEMFGNDTADIDVRALIHGYNLVNWDQNQGTYVFDPSVVRRVVCRTNEDGDREYLIEIADNLKFSNGRPITAWDYAFSILLMMSPEIEQIGGKIYRAEHFPNYKDYIAARRKVIAGEELDLEKDLDYLPDVTVLSDYQLRFWLDRDFLPYFFEIGLLMTVPYPIEEIAPGCKVVSGIIDENGNPLGIKIVNEDESNPEPVYTADLLRKTIFGTNGYDGYNTLPKIVSGPYMIESYDPETAVAHFVINPEFKGAWMENNLPDGSTLTNWQKAFDRGYVVKDTDANGNPLLDADGNEVEVWLVKPTIEKIMFTVADNDTVIEEIVAGEKHLVNKVTYQETIMKGLQARAQGQGVDNQPYPRIGLAFLTFTYDWPTVHEKEVRQAIAWCMDRDALMKMYCGDFGWMIDGYYGLEQWEYKLLRDKTFYPVNFLSEIDGLGTKIEYEDEDEEVKRLMRLRYRYVRDEDEMHVAMGAWDELRRRWDDGEGNTLLTHYVVDLDKANQLLDRAGWTLNREGQPFQPGVDDVRCKMIDGELVALDLTVMYPAGNHMAEFMQEPGMFVDNLAQVGILLTFVPTPMEDLLHSYYRETPRTTDMIYLATNFHVIVDPSITYSTDDTLGHEVWNNTYSDDEVLFERAVDMRQTEPGDIFGYVEKWMDFQDRYNEVLPTIPVYSNIYYDFYTPLLKNYVIDGQVTWSQAILLAYFELDTEEEAPAEDGGEELGDDEFVFDD